MTAIDELLDRVERFNEELTSGRLMHDIIMANEAYIIDMNAYEQLYNKGVNRLGVSIMDYRPYSPYTIGYKKAVGQPYDRVTLRDEGDFYRGFFIEADDRMFYISSTDEKTNKLTKKYTNYIFGLTDENKAELTWEYIYPDLIEKLNEMI